MKVTKPMETVLKKDILLKKARLKRYHSRMMVLTDCFIKWTKPGRGKVRGSMYLLDIQEVYVVTDGECEFGITLEDDVLRWSAESPKEAIEWVTAIEVLYIFMCVCACVYTLPLHLILLLSCHKKIANHKYISTTTTRMPVKD